MVRDRQTVYISSYHGLVSSALLVFLAPTRYIGYVELVSYTHWYHLTDIILLAFRACTYGGNVSPFLIASFVVCLRSQHYGFNNIQLLARYHATLAYRCATGYYIPRLAVPFRACSAVLSPSGDDIG